ncbi:recombinase family protein, partial [Acidiphilium iwatense]
MRVCRMRAEREGWAVADSYSDRATSGASLLRPGIQALMEDAGRHRFDVVLAEAMDRLSRDQEDIAGLFKRLRFAGVTIVTLAEGEIGEMHIGLKGTMNALFLKDLAQKTHRGLRGRIEAGKAAGGKSFGYAIVRKIDAHGEPVRGERAIDAAEAAVVRRIFAMTAEGTSPIAIAKLLNAEKISGPGGRPWGDTTIRGHALRGTGILRNELYIGRLIWNRMRFIKDPATGRRVSRMNPRAEWVVETVPHLRIVDQALWDMVQARLAGSRDASGADASDHPKFHERRRARHILTGKVYCAECGGMFGAVGRDYLACTAARRQGICDNRQSLRRDDLDRLILDALRRQLMRPEHVEQFVADFTTEWNRLQGTIEADNAARRRELETVTRKLDQVIEAICDGLRAPGLQQKLDDLEHRKAELTRQLQNPVAAAPRLHPNLAGLYREKVEQLQTALAASDGGRAALEAVRALIERIDVGQSRPVATASGGTQNLADTEQKLDAATGADVAPSGRGRRRAAPSALPEIVLTGAIAAMVELALSADGNSGAKAPKAAGIGAAGSELFRSSVKVVAGTHNQLDLLLGASRLPSFSHCPESLGEDGQVGEHIGEFLDQWQQARLRHGGD